MSFGAIAFGFLLRLAEALSEGPFLRLLLVFAHVGDNGVGVRAMSIRSRPRELHDATNARNRLAQFRGHGGCGATKMGRIRVGADERGCEGLGDGMRRSRVLVL